MEILRETARVPAWLPDEGTLSPASPRRNRKAAVIQRLRLLWNKRRFLAGAGLAGMLFGSFLAFQLLQKRFQSTTQLMPPDSDSGTGMAMLGALAGGESRGIAASAANLLGMRTSGDLFIGILRSRTVEDRLIARFDLKKVYGQQFEVNARRQLEQNTDIAEDRNSGIISITVTDNDPHRAAEIARAYVEELDRVVAELSTGAAHRERVFLESRLQNVKNQLDGDSRALSQFSSKNAVIDISEQGRAMVTAAQTLQGQLIAGESELQGLRQIYAEENSRVRQVRARVEDLRHHLNQMAGKPQDIGESGSASSVSPSLRQLPLLGVTYASLYNKIKIEETVYNTLTEEYELAKVQEAKETPSVKVLDLAQVPEKKSFPPRAEVILLCGSLAVCGTGLFLLGNAHWEDLDPDDEVKVFTGEIAESVRSYLHLHRRPLRPDQAVTEAESDG